jgi:mercuric reductase
MSAHRFDCDLLVIGTGGGGMGAAIRGAELGYRTVIIEAGTIGGTCVNRGCVPSKTLMRAAATYYHAGHHAFEGVCTRQEGIDWPTLMAQKDALVDNLRREKYVEVLASYDHITLRKGWARLRADGSIEAAGQIYHPARIVIATGARPHIIPLEGIAEVEVLTSTTAMTLAQQPRSLLVIGGRAVALELGQIFARFGTQVTILQRSSRILPEHEPVISEALATYLRQEGVGIYTRVRPLAIHQEGTSKVLLAEVEGQQQRFQAEHVLMATGRVPNTHDMGLDQVEVAMRPNGAIVVDETLRTSHPHIYAVGDVTTLPQLVYVAAAAGSIAAENALTGADRRLDLTVLPDVIFTDPQVATVGLTEAQARQAGYTVQTTTLPLAYVPRAIAARDTRGFITLVAEESSGRLLGTHVLAAEAGEVIQTAALAVECGRRYGFQVDDLRRMLFPYLVQVEGLKLAAQTFAKDVSKLSCCAS